MKTPHRRSRSSEAPGFLRVLVSLVTTLTVLIAVGVGLRAFSVRGNSDEATASADSAPSETTTAAAVSEDSRFKAASPSAVSEDSRQGTTAVSAAAGDSRSRTAAADSRPRTDVAMTAPAQPRSGTDTVSPPSQAVTVAAKAKGEGGPLDSVDIGADPENRSVTIPATVSYEQAEAVFHAGDYGQAAELFGIYLGDRSDNPWGFYMKGISHWKAGQSDEAEAALLACLDRNPDHAKALINLARVRLDQDDPEGALVPVERALSLDAANGSALRVHARVLHNLGRSGEAAAAYMTALRVDDGDAWSMNNLGLIHIESADFYLAVPPLARAVEIDSSVACFRNNLGVALEGVGDYRGALSAYVSATEMDGGYAKAEASRIRLEPIVDGQSVESVDLFQAAEEFVEGLASGTSDQADDLMQASGPAPGTVSGGGASGASGLAEGGLTEVEPEGTGESTSAPNQR